MSTSMEQMKKEATTVFSRVLVGVDGSEQGREAARQAARLAEGEISLLAAYSPPGAYAGITGYTAATYMNEEHEKEKAQETLDQAGADIGREPTVSKIARGAAWESLRREAEDEHATLIAVGSRGLTRGAGIFLGSTATEIVHKAPCSVLIARDGDESFPRKIVVGVDGSPESARAYAAAEHLAERFGAQLWPVVAHGGTEIDREAVDRIVDHRRDDIQDRPVRALVAASADADLVVVGSRGLSGVRALGSVSERVAHQAKSSVLVVREPEAS